MRAVQRKAEAADGEAQAAPDHSEQPVQDAALGAAMVSLEGELLLPEVEITRTAKRRCLERELALRQRTYPKWVKSGRMRQEIAAWELRVLLAILEDYGEP